MAKATSGRGGARPGAGRPPKGPISSEPHKQRPRLLPSQPVHVVMRCAPIVAAMPRADLHAALREATLVVARHEGFRIVHVGMQGAALHLIVEADDRMRLARGMQGFQISAAHQINRLLKGPDGKRRHGKVFLDRYRPTILATPRMVRAALAAMTALPEAERPLITWTPKTALLTTAWRRHAPLR